MPDPTTHRAAGILFLTPDRKALFLKRGPGGDSPGSWCFPGGTTEGDETPEQTAKREATEELGKYPAGALSVHCRTITPVSTITPGYAGEDVVDFTTFLQRVDAEFAPKLNGEHTGWAWADISAPPDPLHPGCVIALARLTMDELGVARAMAAGQLTSPQHYGNVWLFDIQITGTGVSYRGAKFGEKGEKIAEEEFVYQRPENYLTEEFLARCNGLQVIMNHPAKALLNSKEFGMRTIGSVMLPYIKGDEVWGIAKVYDDDAVKAMTSSTMSTSPAVLLGGGNQRMKTEDGTDLLIEGKPSLLDHIAICERGVWDKGGDPSGIRTDNQQGDTDMTKEQLEALQKQIGEMVATAVAGVKTELLASTALARADDAGGARMDKVLAAMDAVCGKMDAFEKKMDAQNARMDAFEKKDSDDEEKKDSDDEMKKMDGESDEAFEKRKSDKAKKDAEEDEKEKKDADMIAADKSKKDADEKAEKEKADAALAADNAELRKRLAAVERNMPKPLTETDRHEFGAAQVRYDDVFQGFGKRAPFPLTGEDVLPYRRQMANELKVHSPTWKDVDVLAIADAATFAVVESVILKESAITALNPTDIPDGKLREITRVDNATGQRFTEFRGNHSFVRSMTRPSRRVTHIGARKEA